MKHPKPFIFKVINFSIAVAALLLTACGVDSEKFRIEGRLRNINQGEFWVYSPDGGIDGMDTMQVRNGRFSYETTLRIPATFVIVFPNYSEQPVFAEPGEKVEIKGDATHLKEMLIKGTDDNDDMTKLRMELNRLMPPEIPGAVAAFTLFPIKWMIFPHFGHTENPDLAMLPVLFPFTTYSPFISSITETCSAFDSGSKRSISGKPRPVSHLLTVLSLTPTISASSACVRARFSLKFFIIFPVAPLSIFSPSFDMIP